MKSNIETHDQENNPESAQHLKENRKKFSQQCLKLMELLNQGKRLTVANAIGYGIMSLPRRVLDCRENGLKIQDEWVKDGNGKRLYKEYFITITTRPNKKQVTEKVKKDLNDNPKWVQPDLL
jgi:ABC-type sugar transport system ATPase subunit